MKADFFQFPANNLLAGFGEIFRVAKERNLDFAILSHNVIALQKKERIKALLEKNEVYNSAVSVCVGQITGKGFNFSPKIPYVSDDGIIVNIKRCEELGIPDRVMQVNTYSHFEDAGGIHATLLSFLEAFIPYGELYSYPYESESQDVGRAWYQCTAQGVVRFLKSLFKSINYEIQKKYDEKI